MLAVLAGLLAFWRPDLMSIQVASDLRTLMQQGQLARIVVVTGVLGFAWPVITTYLAEHWSVDTARMNRHRLRILIWYLLIEAMLAIGVFL